MIGPVVAKHSRRRAVLVTSTLLVAAALSAFGVIAVLCRPGGPLAASEFTHLVSLFVNLGRARLVVAQGVKASDFRVKLFNTSWTQDPYEVFDGQRFATVPTEYGEHDFLVEYRGQRVCMFRHFRSSNWHFADYEFRCRPHEDSARCDVTITQGPGHSAPIVVPESCSNAVAKWDEDLLFLEENRRGR
ncbi:MAG: hypothetical protein QM765_47575 [Myxococcales bacterium]